MLQNLNQNDLKTINGGIAEYLILLGAFGAGVAAVGAYKLAQNNMANIYNICTSSPQTYNSYIYGN
ncbi:hypothetical protein [Clostridium sp. UBA1652]|uniref:hypothetical protein n=1 Tax=Clostridium sp. UBA1652 TaxID=1946348 RepID=UPI00257B6511|nr:hypothetical protein [Clostridium sp. UBA1652]